MLNLTMEPSQMKVQQIPGPPDPDTGDETIAAVLLVFGDPAMNINIGPFAPDEWEAFKGYLIDPEGESERQRARERIEIVTGGVPLPKMATVKGK